MMDPFEKKHFTILSHRAEDLLSKDPLGSIWAQEMCVYEKAGTENITSSEVLSHSSMFSKIKLISCQWKKTYNDSGNGH